MDNGWVKIHRKLRNNPIYTKPVGLLIWLECLLSATHEIVKIDYAGEERNLNPGEFVFGRIEWSKRLKLSPRTVYKWVQRMTERGMIRAQVRGHGKPTIFKVEKWEEYQDGGQVGGQVGIQPRDRLVYTNKNVKNVKNVKKGEITKEFINELIVDNRFRLVNVEDEYEKFEDYKKSTGRRYKDNRAAFRNWLRKAVSFVVEKNPDKLLIKKKNNDPLLKYTRLDGVPVSD